MSDDYAAIVKALARCSVLPESWDKRFIRDLDGQRYQGDARHLSFPQRVAILRLAVKYRCQVPAEILRLAAQLKAQELAA